MLNFGQRGQSRRSTEFCPRILTRGMFSSFLWVCCRKEHKIYYQYQNILANHRLLHLALIEFYNIQMGDNVSVEEKKNFQEKLHFVQKTQDPNFSHIQIFRFKEPPYEYIMDYQKTFMDGDNRYEAYTAFIQKLQQKQHKNLAKVHLSEVRKENHMCIKDTKVHTFCNYYNFTLKQAIDKKKVKDSRFSQAQLSYIMSCLLDLAVYLKQSGIVLGDYRSDKIFLSPQGYIKVYTLQLQKQNKHTAYFKALVDRSLIEQMILSPEQLIFIQRLEYQPQIDIYKADVFAIGMIILELMTLDKTKFYYNQDKTSIKMGRISFDLSSFSSEYSPQFVDILRSCLAQNPRQRTTLEQASHRLQQLRKKSQNVSYCIRLHDDDQQVKKKPTTSMKGQYILTGIQKRLTPSPITTLSSSASSGFYSKNSTQNFQESKHRFHNR